MTIAHIPVMPFPQSRAALLYLIRCKFISSILRCQYCLTSVTYFLYFWFWSRCSGALPCDSVPQVTQDVILGPLGFTAIVHIAYGRSDLQNPSQVAIPLFTISIAHAFFVVVAEQASVTCALTGPLDIPDVSKIRGLQGHEVFSERKSLSFFQNKVKSPHRSS